MSHYKHEGEGYSYIATEKWEDGRIWDWYFCDSPSGRRALFCRMGEKGDHYSSTTITGTVEPSQLELAAYERGFTFSDKELIEFGHRYLEMMSRKRSREQQKVIIPDSFDGSSLLGAENKQCPRCHQRKTRQSGDNVHGGYDGFPVCSNCGEV